MDTSLPSYPSEIRGTVRHILVLKDFLLLCSRLLERYCRFGSLASRQLSREYILSAISLGNETIEVLKRDLINQQAINSEFENKLFDLRQEISNRIELFNKHDLVVFESVCFRLKNGKNRTKLGADKCIDIYYNRNEIELVLPDPFECQKLKTILEFLQELYLIQLHFHVIIVQGLNFALPLLVNGLHFIDRLIYWPKRPEFGMTHKRINFSDKLRDIQVELQRLVEELVSACLIVEAKFLYDQKLEFYYHKTVENQCLEKIMILERIQYEKELYDFIKLEHSRIVGYILKKDPSFANESIILDYPQSKTSNKDDMTKSTPGQSTSASTYSTDQISNTNSKSINVQSKPTVKKSTKTVTKSTQKSKNNVNNNIIKHLPKVSSTNNGTITSSDDKTIEELLALSSSFSFQSVDSVSSFKEPTSTKCLEKMYGIVDDIIDRDWNEISNWKKNI